MRLQHTAIAGTLESSDVMVTLKPNPEPGVKIQIQSKVYAQYGDSMQATVKEVLRDFDISDAIVELNDKGALDCVIRARTQTAVCRALGVSFPWKEAAK